MAEPNLTLIEMRSREDFLEWGDGMEKAGLPLAAEIYRVIARDDGLFSLSLEAQPGQFSGWMLLAAVHFMLLRSPDHELAAYFPTITSDPRPTADVGPSFIAFCKEHREELGEILRTHTLQTTSVGRAAQVFLALDHVSSVIGEPFSIIDVGCSAGLLLEFDHYRYQFPNGREVGDDEAKVVVSSFEFVGDAASVPTEFPKIKDRIGLDLNLVDATDAGARNWILGCTIPDRVEDFNVLRAALDYRASVPLKAVSGDAIVTLPGALDQIDGHVCVYHSRCLYQWPQAAQEAFSAKLRELGKGRTIHRVGIEWNSDTARNEITHTIYRDGASDTTLLGITNKTRVEWWGENSRAAA